MDPSGICIASAGEGSRKGDCEGNGEPVLTLITTKSTVAIDQE